MKYIVYKTTNLVNNFIYIGVHKTENPEVWDHYLGNGIYDNRPLTYKKSKTALQQAVSQFGIKNFKREIISIFDTCEEAYALEGLIVNDDFLARHDVYNMIKGGIVNKIEGKKVYQYNSNTGKFIKEFNSLSEAGQSVNCDSSNICRGIKYNYFVKNFAWSFNKVDTLDLTVFNPKILIPVYRYTSDGKFDKEFKSLTKAGTESDASAVYIQKAATLGYLVNNVYYFSFYKFDSFDKARTQQIQNRRVFMYDANGSFVKEYESQRKAELENQYCNITNCIKFRYPDKNGNYWSLEKLKEYNKPIYRTPKKVAKLSNSGEIIQTWDSSNSCVKEVGTAVKNVLRGKYEKHKGFKYIYL